MNRTLGIIWTRRGLPFGTWWSKRRQPPPVPPTSMHPHTEGSSLLFLPASPSAGGALCSCPVLIPSVAEAGWWWCGLNSRRGIHPRGLLALAHELRLCQQDRPGVWCRSWHRLAAGLAHRIRGPLAPWQRVEWCPTGESEGPSAIWSPVDELHACGSCDDPKLFRLTSLTDRGPRKMMSVFSRVYTRKDSGLTQCHVFSVLGNNCGWSM